MSFVLFKQTLAPGAIAPSVRKRSTPVALPSLPHLLHPHLLLPSPAPEPSEAVVLEAMEESPPSASLPPSPPEAMILLDRRRWLRRGQPHPCKPSPAPLQLPKEPSSDPAVPRTSAGAGRFDRLLVALRLVQLLQSRRAHAVEAACLVLALCWGNLIQQKGFAVMIPLAVAGLVALLWLDERYMPALARLGCLAGVGLALFNVAETASRTPSDVEDWYEVVRRTDPGDQAAIMVAALYGTGVGSLPPTYLSRRAKWLVWLSLVVLVYLADTCNPTSSLCSRCGDRPPHGCLRPVEHWIGPSLSEAAALPKGSPHSLGFLGVLLMHPIISPLSGSFVACDAVTDWSWRWSRAFMSPTACTAALVLKGAGAKQMLHHRPEIHCLCP